MRDKFDSSNYDKHHPLYSLKNKAKLGCFKDECGGRILEEFLLAKPKAYSMLYVDDKTSIKRLKGIPKAVVRNFTHEDYKQAYDNDNESVEQFTLIQSHRHKVETVNKRKRGRSFFEDKRCWLGKNFSLPYGHYALNLPPPSKRTRTLPISGDIID